jgi:ABC-type glycerol-3-phosphate transport system substrate-binding protein
LWQDLIYQQSGWLYNEDGTKALWEEEPSVVALQFIQDWYNKHGIDSLELPAGYGGFCNDLAAMFIGSGWNTGFFLPEFPQMEGRFDTAIIPTYTGKPEPSYGLGSPEENWQTFTNYSDEEKAAAFAFIQHMMASDERAVEWALAQQCAPDSKKVLTDERVTAIPTIRSQSVSMPYRVCYGERPIEAEKLWRTMFDQVILENRAPKDALHDATVEIDKVLPTKERVFTERNYKPGG